MRFPSEGDWVLDRATNQVGRVTVAIGGHEPFSCRDAHPATPNRCGHVVIQWENELEGITGSTSGPWFTGQFTPLISADRARAVRHLFEQIDKLESQVRNLRHIVQEIAHPTKETAQ